MAMAETFRLAFREPWQYGFVFPVACALPFFRRFRTPDFAWHLKSLARLLWPPAVLFLFHISTTGLRTGLTQSHP